jgi:hypothetical protein
MNYRSNSQEFAGLKQKIGDCWMVVLSIRLHHATADLGTQAPFMHVFPRTILRGHFSCSVLWAPRLLQGVRMDAVR